MGKGKGAAFFEVRTDFVLIDIGLFFIRDEDHGDVRFSNRFTDRLDGKTRFSGSFCGMAVLIKPYDNIYTAFLEIQGMGVSLAAIADDGDFLSFQYFPIDILIIKYLCHVLYLFLFLAGGLIRLVGIDAVFAKIKRSVPLRDGFKSPRYHPDSWPLTRSRRSQTYQHTRFL